VARLQAPPPVPPVAGRRLLGLMRSRLVVAGLILGSIEFASFGAFDAIWAILLTDLGASTSFVGLSFTLIAGPLIFLATPFGRLIDRRSPLPISALGMVLLLPAVAAYGRLGAPITLALAGVVHAAASAAIGPAGAALVARGSPPDMIARGQGLLEAVGFLAAAATALPSGWAYDTVGRGVWFGGLAGLLAVLFLVAWRLGRPSSAGDGAALPRGSG
ncbi:MAG TPA: MFS transporter, partial [Gemmatimonadales bacterium]|nr:MFS transporter [Gemmatimonadales bacterium]